MSRYIATRALRGANLIVNEFDQQLQKALAELGPEKEIHFTNTAYYLPTILGYTGMKVETIGGLKRIVQSIETMYGVDAEIVFEDGLPAVVSLRPDVGNTWFVTFETEEDALREIGRASCRERV